MVVFTIICVCVHGCIYVIPTHTSTDIESHTYVDVAYIWYVSNQSLDMRLFYLSPDWLELLIKSLHWLNGILLLNPLP